MAIPDSLVKFGTAAGPWATAAGAIFTLWSEGKTRKLLRQQIALLKEISGKLDEIDQKLNTISQKIDQLPEIIYKGTQRALNEFELQRRYNDLDTTIDLYTQIPDLGVMDLTSDAFTKYAQDYRYIIRNEQRISYFMKSAKYSGFLAVITEGKAKPLLDEWVGEQHKSLQSLLSASLEEIRKSLGTIDEALNSSHEDYLLPDLKEAGKYSYKYTHNFNSRLASIDDLNYQLMLGSYDQAYRLVRDLCTSPISDGAVGQIRCGSIRTAVQKRITELKSGYTKRSVSVESSIENIKNLSKTSALVQMIVNFLGDFLQTDASAFASEEKAQIGINSDLFFSASQEEREEITSLLVLFGNVLYCLLYTSPSPRDLSTSRMPSSA